MYFYHKGKVEHLILDLDWPHEVDSLLLQVTKLRTSKMFRRSQPFLVGRLILAMLEFMKLWSCLLQVTTRTKKDVAVAAADALHFKMMQDQVTCRRWSSCWAESQRVQTEGMTGRAARPRGELRDMVRGPTVHTQHWTRHREAGLAPGRVRQLCGRQQHCRSWEGHWFLQHEILRGLRGS